MTQEHKDTIKGLILSNVDQESLEDFFAEIAAKVEGDENVTVEDFADAVVNLIFDPLKK